MWAIKFVKSESTNFCNLPFYKIQKDIRSRISFRIEKSIRYTLNGFVSIIAVDRLSEAFMIHRRPKDKHRRKIADHYLFKLRVILSIYLAWMRLISGINTTHMRNSLKEDNLSLE